MVQWLVFVNYSKPPSTEEVDKWVHALFETVDTDKSGTLELEEMINCYVSTPLITDCFASMPEMMVPDAGSEGDDDGHAAKREGKIDDGCRCLLQ